MMKTAVGIALILVLATPVAAQRPLRDPDARTTLSGVVVDALRGDALPNSIVVLADENRGILTDSLGRFSFPNVQFGPQLLAVKQYGYEEVNLDLDLLEGHGPVRVEIRPRPIALEGFAVVADNLAAMRRQITNRRNAYGRSARAISQASLTTSTARTVIDLLRTRGGLQLRQCGSLRAGPATSFRPVGGESAAGRCVLRRGRSVRPRVYIDEARIMGGLEFLAMFRPYELYLVEVYSSGLEIRAYTHWFVERMAARPRKLWPIGL